MTVCDSHIHLVHCDFEGDFFKSDEYFPVANFCFKTEFENFSRSEFFGAKHLRSSFGIHPQAVDDFFMRNHFESELSFLETLLSEKKIDAVGECGFDFFTQEFKSTKENQEIAWSRQIELAASYGTPLVVHLRKAVEKIFRDSKILKKIPSVVFHSFPGAVAEAKSILSHGVNAYFSFGKPLLNGKKSAIDCVKNLPLERLVLETDAPYQTLKGEESTVPSDIFRVYEAASKIRGDSVDVLSESIFENFRRIYF